MSACDSYLIITTFSLPALAIYDAGAALCRSIKKTNVTMYISVISNVLNVVGNCVGVFVLHMGVAGVAYPSLITRIISAAIRTRNLSDFFFFIQYTHCDAASFFYRGMENQCTS